MNNYEKIIDFLLVKYEKSKTNEVSISKLDIETLSIEEKGLVKTIFLLQEDGLISIKSKSVHNDLSIPMKIVLKSNCVHYYEIKKENEKNNEKDELRFWLPFLFSLLSILISIVAIYA